MILYTETAKTTTGNYGTTFIKVTARRAYLFFEILGLIKSRKNYALFKLWVQIKNFILRYMSVPSHA